MCFRCGFARHLPADCKAKSTSAGRPVMALSTDAQSKNTLITSDGKQLCFNWAKDSTCSFHGAFQCLFLIPILCLHQSLNKAVHLLHTLGLYDKWKHIIIGLQSGFDVSIKEAPTHTLIFNNHASSRLNPDFISTYLRNEKSVGHYP